MSWSILIGILIVFILLLIYSQTLQKIDCCETNLRLVLSTIAIIGGIIWIFFMLIFTLNVVTKEEYKKVNIEYLLKSNTRVYLEYTTTKNNIIKYKYYDKIKDMSIDTNTIFFIKHKYNMYNYSYTELLYNTKIPDDKIIK